MLRTVARSAGLGVMEGDGSVYGREVHGQWFSWILVVEQVVGLTWGMPPRSPSEGGKNERFR